MAFSLQPAFFPSLPLGLLFRLASLACRLPLVFLP